MAIGIGLMALIVVFAGVAFLVLILLGIGRLVQAVLEHPGMRQAATGAAAVLGFLFGMLVYQWLAYHRAEAIAQAHQADAIAFEEARRIDEERHFAEVAPRPTEGVTNIIRGNGNVVRVENARPADATAQVFPNPPARPVPQLDPVPRAPRLPTPRVAVVPNVPPNAAPQAVVPNAAPQAVAPNAAPQAVAGQDFVPPKGAIEANRDGIKILNEDGSTFLRMDDDGIRVGNATIDKHGLRFVPDEPARPTTAPPRAAASEIRARAKAAVASAAPDQPPLGWDGPTEPRRKRPAWIDDSTKYWNEVILQSLLSPTVEDARADLLVQVTAAVRKELPPETPPDLAVPNTLVMRTIDELWWETSPSERLGQDMLRLHARVRFTPAIREELAALVRRRVASERAEQFTFWGLGLLGGFGLVWGATRLTSGGRRPAWPPENATA